MRLTEQDQKLFDALNGSDIGKYLVSYLERLNVDVCDARNWPDGAGKDQALFVAETIQKHIIDKVNLRGDLEPERNPYPYV